MSQCLSHTPLINAVPRDLLLVTPDDVMAKEMSQRLRDVSFNVTRLKSPERALEAILEDGRVDAWIGDGSRMLAGITDPLLRHLRLSLEALKIPLVLTIDPDCETDWQSIHRLSADEFILKPLQEPEMVARLRALLHREDAESRRYDEPVFTAAAEEFVKYVRRDLTNRITQNRSSVLCLVEAFGTTRLEAEGRQAEAKSLTEAVYSFLAMNLRRMDRLVQYDHKRVAVYQPDRNLTGAEHAFELICSEIGAQQSNPLCIGLAEFPQDGANFDDLIRWADRSLDLARERPGKIMARAWMTSYAEREKPERIVLWADDDSSAWSLVNSTVRLLGHETLLAKNRREVLGALDRNVPALMVLGQTFDARAGLELLHDLHRQCEGRLAFPVLLMTPLADENEVLQGIEWGVQDFLKKPIHPRELQVRIARMLAT